MSLSLNEYTLCCSILFILLIILPKGAPKSILRGFRM